MQKKLSIKAAFEERERLEQKVQAIWQDLAYELVKLIPQSMQRFAKEEHWIRDEVACWWQLPEFLNSLVSYARLRHPKIENYAEDALASYGFENFEELKAGFRELELAWNGLISIKFQSSGRQLRVYFYASEISNERKS